MSFLWLRNFCVWFGDLSWLLVWIWCWWVFPLHFPGLISVAFPISRRCCCCWCRLKCQFSFVSVSLSSLRFYFLFHFLFLFFFKFTPVVLLEGLGSGSNKQINKQTNRETDKLWPWHNRWHSSRANQPN